MKYNPPVIREDRANHFVYGAWTYALTVLVARCFVPHEWATFIGFACTLGVAALREYVLGTSLPDPYDIFWTMAGAGTVWVAH